MGGEERSLCSRQSCGLGLPAQVSLEVGMSLEVALSLNLLKETLGGMQVPCKAERGG